MPIRNQIGKSKKNRTLNNHSEKRAAKASIGTTNDMR